MNASHPILTANWLDAVFIHFRVDATRLQQQVPLEVDRFEGESYISLVAFTQRDLRPLRGGRLARWLALPLGHHAFLNVRTYVKLGQDRGIYFMTEWIPNRLAAMIGPRTYGLPYQLARLRYTQTRRTILTGGNQLTIDLKEIPADLGPATPGTLDHFLLERYSAWTCRGGIIRRFDVDHAPWNQARVDARISDDGLLARSGNWFKDAEPAGANYSPGVRDVMISAPRRVTAGAVSMPR